jgi:hypothetical protein
LSGSKRHLSIEKTVFKAYRSSAKDRSIDSPKAYFDEDNRKVMIVSVDPDEGNEVQHCITWNDEAEPDEIEQAI